MLLLKLDLIADIMFSSALLAILAGLGLPRSFELIVGLNEQGQLIVLLLLLVLDRSQLLIRHNLRLHALC